MSTPSKKRRAARAWMAEAIKKYTEAGHKVGRDVGIREGAARMRDDMMRLIPHHEGHEIDHATGKPHVRQTIKRFPDPYENGGYFRVVMPTGGYGSWPMHPMRGNNAFAQTIDFRPIEHRITSEGPGGVATLSWFTWEPSTGSEEIGEHTSALFTGMGKLGYAASVIEGLALYSADHAGNGELLRASELLRECSDEFRRRLGKFAPVPPAEDFDTQRRRYLFGRFG